MSNRLRKHAKRHESGGLDEIDLDGLGGANVKFDHIAEKTAAHNIVLDNDLDLGANKIIHNSFVLKLHSGNDIAFMDVAENAYMDLRINSLQPYSIIAFANTNASILTRNSITASIAFSTRYGGGVECAKLLTTGSNLGEFNISRAGDVEFLAGKILKNADHIEGDEITTPTAVADHWKLYSKSDNKLYFQDGAGFEHEVSLTT